MVKNDFAVGCLLGVLGAAVKMLMALISHMITSFMYSRCAQSDDIRVVLLKQNYSSLDAHMKCWLSRWLACVRLPAFCWLACRLGLRADSSKSRA